MSPPPPYKPDFGIDNEHDHDDQELHLPRSSPPADLSHHLSQMSKRREASLIKGLYKYFMLPGMRNLAAGAPSADLFPFDTLEGDIQSYASHPVPEGGGSDMGVSSAHGRPVGDNDRSDHTPTDLRMALKAFLFPTTESGNGLSSSSSSSSHLRIPKYPSSPPGNNPLNFPITLSTALQYSMADGYLPLSTFITKFVTTRLHHPQPPYSPGPGVLLTCGTTDGLSKVFEMLLAEGDTLLCEEYTYTPALSTPKAVGCGIVSVGMDDEGMRVEGRGGLRDVLENWDRWGRGIGGMRKPRVLYTVSVGQNPTGRTVPLERRRQIYELCETHDIIIVEDDPYWHLQYTHSSSSSPVDGFLPSLTQSYLTLDPSGRVIHLSTFSKLLAPGCRLGWITAQPFFIERLLRAAESGSGPPSGFVQGLVAELLCTRWGMDGWIRWIAGLRGVYERKMQAMVDVLNDSGAGEIVQEHDDDNGLIHVSKARIYTFTPPSAGMFVWLRMLYHTHPLAHGDNPFSTSYLAQKCWMYLAETHRVLVSPGAIFHVPPPPPTAAAAALDDGPGGGGDDHFRLSFAPFEDPREVAEITRAFVKGVREFWGLSRDEVEGIGLGEEGEGEGEEEERGSPWQAGWC